MIIFSFYTAPKDSLKQFCDCKKNTNTNIIMGNNFTTGFQYYMITQNNPIKCFYLISDYDIFFLKPFIVSNQPIQFIINNKGVNLCIAKGVDTSL